MVAKWDALKLGSHLLLVACMCEKWVLTETWKQSGFIIFICHLTYQKKKKKKSFRMPRRDNTSFYEKNETPIVFDKFSHTAE